MYKKWIIKRRIIIIVIILILLFIISMPIVDYIRSKNNKLPIFAVVVTTYKDGGSRVYLGLGYKVYVIVDQDKYFDENNQNKKYEDYIDIVFTHLFSSFDKEKEKLSKRKNTIPDLNFEIRLKKPYFFYFK